MKERMESRGKKAGDTPDKRRDKRIVRMRRGRLLTGWEGGSGERVDVKGKVGRGVVWEGVEDRTLERDGFLYDEEETREGG